MGRCSIPPLFTYLQSASGISIDRSRSFMYTDGVQDDLALGGSNITVQCLAGFVNVGGSLTIVCTEANSWTQFPNCSPLSPTTVALPLRCPVPNNAWRLDNGYVSNFGSLIEYNDNTALGNIRVLVDEILNCASLFSDRLSCFLVLFWLRDGFG